MAVPSDVELRIRTPSSAMVAEGSEEAGAVDNVSATLSAAAERGARSLSLSGAPGVVPGRDYLLTDAATGKRTVVEPLIDAATMTVSSPLPFAVASGSTLSGIAITHVLEESETEADGEGLILVSAILDGVRRAWSETLRVSRELPAYTLTWPRLVGACPQAIKLRGQVDLDPREAIHNAWEYKLRPELRARKIREHQINEWESLEPVHALAVVVRMTEEAYPGDIERLEDVRRQYNDALKQMFASRELWIDIADTDEERSDPGDSPSPYNYTRLVR